MEVGRLSYWIDAALLGIQLTLVLNILSGAMALELMLTLSIFSVYDDLGF
jgi:hypothetical protein